MGTIVRGTGVAEGRHFHGIVTRFSAGNVDAKAVAELASLLEPIKGSGGKVHCSGVGLAAQEAQGLLAGLRQLGVDSVVDRFLPGRGERVLIFSPGALTPELSAAVAQAASKQPAGRKLIDCEGSAYLVHSLL